MDTSWIPTFLFLLYMRSLERIIDDVVFLCFFVGNDFLPHLPSLDIRDGALDYLFNVYKRLLPTFPDYITNHGGQVNLSNVDVILAEVGAIEDYVFAMKHDNEERQKKRMEEMKARTKQGKQLQAPPVVAPAQSDGPPKALGRAARILEKERARENQDVTVALGRGHQAKEEARKDLKAHKMVAEANAKAALELKKSLGGGGGNAAAKSEDTAKKHDKEEEAMDTTTDDANGDGADAGLKRKHEDVEESESKEKKEAKTKVEIEVEGFGGKIEEAEFDDDVDNDDDDEEDEDDEEENEVEIPPEVEVDPKLAAAFKEKVKDAKSKQLDEFAKSVEDNVRLHETGWKVSQVVCYSCHC